MNDREKKALKRLLKELGIYHLWIKNRMKYSTYAAQKPEGFKKYFWPYLSNNFAELIDDSFTWNRTGQEELWEELNALAICNDYPSKILKNQQIIDELNETCKHYLDSYN